MGIPPNHPFIDGFLHCKPSSYWGTLIYANLHWQIPWFHPTCFTRKSTLFTNHRGTAMCFMTFMKLKRLDNCIFRFGQEGDGRAPRKTNENHCEIRFPMRPKGLRPKDDLLVLLVHGELGCFRRLHCFIHLYIFV